MLGCCLITHKTSWKSLQAACYGYSRIGFTVSCYLRFLHFLSCLCFGAGAHVFAFFVSIYWCEMKKNKWLIFWFLISYCSKTSSREIPVSHPWLSVKRAEQLRTYITANTLPPPTSFRHTKKSKIKQIAASCLVSVGKKTQHIISSCYLFIATIWIWNMLSFELISRSLAPK